MKFIKIYSHCTRCEQTFNCTEWEDTEENRKDCAIGSKVWLECDHCKCYTYHLVDDVNEAI